MRVRWDRNIVRRTLFKSPGAESRVPIYHYKKMSLFAVAPTMDVDASLGCLVLGRM